MAKPLEERIFGLSELSRAELVMRFRQTFRINPGSRASRELLTLAIAYRLQEEAEGGLSERARRRLNRSAYDPSPGKISPKPPPLRFKPGTRFIRIWQGDGHQVTVLESGFSYGGQHYKSLSAIARTITGTRWSGPAFFGLKKIQAQEVVHA